MKELLELLPSLILLIFSMGSLIITNGSKYSRKKTMLIVIPFMFVLIVINAWIFKPHGIVSFDNYSILTVYLPEFIVAGILSKRKGISMIVAMIDAFVTFYLLVLLRNLSSAFFNNVFTEYVFYLSFVPLLFVYLKFFYNNFHEQLEETIPNSLIFLGSYSLIMFIEFYVYRYLIQTATEKIVQLEIFGIALILTYITSIIIFDLLFRHYKNTIDKANENELLNKQFNSMLQQYEIKEEKEKELMILRHDMKHLLVTVSSLFKQNKNEDALKIIDEYRKNIETTKDEKYCNNTVVNAVLSYYKRICNEKGIYVNIQIKDINEINNIKQSDLAILLSNCFDNAIKATNKVKDNKYIEFKFINSNGQIVLQMRNTFDGDISLDRNNLPTNEAERHGYGTKSIVGFCRKNKLTFDYDISENLFTLSIIF